MIVEECHHRRGIRIEIIIDKGIVEAVHATPPRIGLLMLCGVECLLEGEVHYGLQIGIVFRQFRVFLPRGSIGRHGDPRLAYGIEVRIFLVEFLHPLCHRLCKGIRIGVHADAVNTDGLYPPLGVLDEIAHQVGIALVEVGHRRDEPSLYGLTFVNLRSIGIDNRSELIGGLQEICTTGIAGTTRLLQPVAQVEPIL